MNYFKKYKNTILIFLLIFFLLLFIYNIFNIYENYEKLPDEFAKSQEYAKSLVKNH